MTRSVSSPPSRPPDAGSERALHRLSFAALGTTCEVQYVAPPDVRRSEPFEQAAIQWVTAFEARYSRFRPTSLISQINAAAGREWIDVDLEMEGLFTLCDAIYQMTDGVLDPTILPLMNLWNWKAEFPVVPGAEALTAARALIGWPKVQRRPGQVFLPRPGMALDFGGFGKEYAVDIVAQIAVDHGIADVLVDFGHDLRVLGHPPGRPAWHIGLEDPLQPGKSAGSLAIQGNRGIASSGDYVRCFHANGRRYGHIIDPRTGWPVSNGCLQATIVADTCLQAGVLSTSAFVLGVPKGLNHIQDYPKAEGLIVTDRLRAQTRNFHQYEAV